MNGRDFFRCLMYNLLVHVCVFLSYYLDSNVLGRPCYDYRSASERRLVRARGRCKSYARGLRCLICCTYEKLAAEQELRSDQCAGLALADMHQFPFPSCFFFLVSSCLSCKPAFFVLVSISISANQRAPPPLPLHLVIVPTYELHTCIPDAM
jgi:hypothetical protein